MANHLLHESLTRSLLEEMASGLYREGERFFSVRNIKRLWRVSDSTAITSLKKLASMGLIAPKDRSGYYLCERFQQRAQLCLRRHRHPALKPPQSLIQKRRSLTPEQGGNIAMIFEMVPPSLLKQQNGNIISSSELKRTLKAFERVGAKYGFTPVWVGYPSDPGEIPALEAALAQGDFKGAVVYCRSNHRQMKLYLEPLLRRRWPVVAIFDDCSGLPIHSVNVNNVGVGYDAVQQLYRMGHRRIAVLMRQKPLKIHRERLKGALLAQSERGVELEVYKVAPNQTGWTARFLAPDRPTALFVIERKLIAPLAPLFREHDLAVPRDLSIIISSSKNVLPGFEQPADSMNHRVGNRVGRLAAEMLYRIQKGDPVEKGALVNVSYIARGSVARPPC